MGRLTDRRNVIDILDKMNFFQGQRAGRELWNDKPRNVQEEDLDNFNRDIRTIRDYIWDLEHELKYYTDADEQGLLLRLPCPKGTTVYTTHWWDDVEEKVKVDGKTYYRKVKKNKVSKERFHILDIDAFGKTVFLTKEEAEEALKKMRENGDE